jgi:hypothetical protein
MEKVDNEEAEAFTTQPPTRGKGKGKGKTIITATSPEASPSSSISSFFMEEEKPSEVDQIQQEFETKIKNKYQDIVKMNRKIDIKIQKINKYLVLKQQLVRKKKQNLVELEKKK